MRKSVIKFLNGYCYNDKKSFFLKPKVIDIYESDYEEFTPEEQNYICKQVIETKVNVSNYISYLIKKDLFKNLEPDVLADLMEEYSNDDELYSLVFEDDSFKFTFDRHVELSIAIIEKYIPEEKRTPVIKKILPRLNEEFKLVAYSLVSEKDRDSLKEEMGISLSKESLINNIGKLLSKTNNPTFKQGDEYKMENDWLGLHCEKVLDIFKDDFSMNEMDNIFKKSVEIIREPKTSVVSTNIAGILEKNSERVSPNLLFEYIRYYHNRGERGFFEEKQKDNIINKNIHRFSKSHHDEGLGISNPELKVKFIEMGKTKEKLFETIEKLPQEKRFEAMKKSKDYLYDYDVEILMRSLPDDEKEEALKYFEDHLTPDDIERIFEYVMPKNLNELRIKKAREKAKNTPDEEIEKLKGVIESIESNNSSFGGKGSL